MAHSFSLNLVFWPCLFAFWMSAKLSLVCFITAHTLAASSVFICQLPARQSRPNFHAALSESERRKASRLSWVYTNPGGMHSILLPAPLRLSKSPQARGSQTGSRPVFKETFRRSNDLYVFFFSTMEINYFFTVWFRLLVLFLTRQSTWTPPATYL